MVCYDVLDMVYMGVVKSDNKVWYVMMFWTWYTSVQSTIATIHRVMLFGLCNSYSRSTVTMSNGACS